MSNFDSMDPSTCEALGSKLKNIQVSAADANNNKCIDFDSSDWVKDDKNFKMVITPLQHGRDEKPIASIQESVSGCYKVVGVGEIWKSDGTLELQVNCDPDCRFSGRIILDG